jgi:DNA polymerase III subunit delta'
MIDIEPINQTKLFGLDKYINELIKLDKKNILPNKILLSGKKGLGKSTLAYHFINYILSKEDVHKYNTDTFAINPENPSFKTILNKSNQNFILIDVNPEKKMIDINQIRQLILNLNKFCLNNKPRFILIDNIEFLNVNSVNAILKVLEEPSFNVHFILINNNKKILPTLLSRCINFKISLTNNETQDVYKKMINESSYKTINSDLINYYSTPGNIYNLVKFAKVNNYDLSNLTLKEFLKTYINDNHYKKKNLVSYLIFELIEFYFNKINSSISSNVYNKYNYFLKRISDTKRFNLDEETLFIEFKNAILNE